MALYKRTPRSNYTANFTHLGVRICKSTGTTDHAEALEFVEQEKAKIEQGLDEDPQDILLLSEAIEMEYAERWAEQADDMVYPRLQIVLDMVGDVPVHELTAARIAKLRRDLSKPNEDGAVRSAATVNRYMGLLKTVLRACHNKWEVIDRIPYIEMKSEKGNERTTLVTEEQLQQLAEHLRKPPEKGKRQTQRPHVADLLEVLWHTGMRRGEALKLEWKMIDFERHIIILPGYVVKNGKSRAVPMSGRVASILKKRSELPKPFTLRPRYVSHIVRDARRELNLPESISVHPIRHTVTTRLMVAGKNPNLVQAMLGHSNLTMTERYTHVQPNHLSGLVDVFDQTHDAGHDAGKS